MGTPRPLRLTPEWDDRFTGMLVLSAVGHAAALAAILLLAGRGDADRMPLVAYTVELTDPSALGGRLPPGAPGPNLTGGVSHPPAPEPKGEAAPAAKAPEPKPAPPPEAKPVPEPAKPEPPKPETKPEPKEVATAEQEAVHLPEKPPAPTPEPPKPEPPKPEPPKPQPPKPEPPRAEPAKPEPRKPPEPPKTPPAPPKPAPEKAAPPARAEGQHAPPKGPEAQAESKPGSPAGKDDVAPRDAYAAAAERWRTRGGGGLGGTEEGSGPIGAGGEGKGGGGQLVGLEFLAYRQEVINTIKAQWTNVIARPGLVAAVRFEIASDGQVSNIRLARSSGNGAYDASALRAVQHTSRLPAPPARYASEFREFIIEFHSEETGGQGTG